MQRVGIDAGTRREEMGIAMSMALALERWHGFGYFHHASQNTIILLVLVGLAVLALLVWAVRRRRRRWF
ncbi:MAG: LPXTG cell wall anchor domain-containing protein [Terracidiphilus sp.]|jgi:LPXTG-motif cell wall-anchored protein